MLDLASSPSWARYLSGWPRKRGARSSFFPNGRLQYISAIHLPMADEECRRSGAEALLVGCLSIDSTAAYGKEKAVGKLVAEGGMPRSVTKERGMYWRLL